MTEQETYQTKQLFNALNVCVTANVVLHNLSVEQVLLAVSNNFFKFLYDCTENGTTKEQHIKYITNALDEYAAYMKTLDLTNAPTTLTTQ